MKTATGIEGLDKMLMGGVIQGRNVLLSGPCGSGKSILAMQFLYHGAMLYEEPGLYITLEETKEKFTEAMLNLNLPENTHILKELYGVNGLVKTNTQDYLGDFGPAFEALTGIQDKVLAKKK